MKRSIGISFAVFSFAWIVSLGLGRNLWASHTRPKSVRYDLHGQLQNRTQLKSSDLRIRLKWTRFLSASFEDGCKNPVSESAEASVGPDGSFRFPKVGSDHFTLCSIRWEISILMPNGDEIPFLDDAELNQPQSEDEFLSFFTAIRIAKAPDIRVISHDANGDVPTYLQYLDLDLRLFGDLSLTSVDPASSFRPYNEFQVTQSPQVFQGLYFAWSKSDVKGIDIRLSNFNEFDPHKEWKLFIPVERFGEPQKIEVSL